MEIMDPKKIIEICSERLSGTVIVDAWGEKGIFYNPNYVLKRGVYVLTVKQKDGDNDKGSNLNRENVYRLNTGVSKTTFKQIFDKIPLRPPAGGLVDMNYDFTEVDKILPHPVYAWMGWICVLNPTTETFSDFLRYIDEAYDLAKKKFEKKIKK